MAQQWGNNTLGAGQSAHYYFVHDVHFGRLTTMAVVPLSPAFTPSQYTIPNFSGWPVFNQLGYSSTWVEMSDDSNHIVYHMAVTNRSNSTMSFAFLEGEL